jgi:rod shape-determining protein MreD
MRKLARHTNFAIILSLLLAIVFTIMPLPSWATWFRPLWVLLVLCYWAMALDGQVGVGWAWLLGLLLDILQGSVMGEHALVLSCCVYLVCKLRRQLRLNPLWQQAVVIFILCLFYQATVYLIQGMLGQAPASGLYWFAMFTSALVWPWIFILLRDLRRGRN